MTNIERQYWSEEGGNDIYQKYTMADKTVAYRMMEICSNGPKQVVDKAYFENDQGN